MSKRVAVYARVSTARQADNDISIPDQLAQARRYCDTKRWTVIREFIDAGVSARDDKRPDLQRMIDMACTDPSPFDVVLVHSQSRFFRDAVSYGLYKRKLEKHGVLLVSMTQDFGEGPSAEFAETVIAAADALSSAENAKHTSRSMIENARQGFWNGSRPPFGYRTIDAEKRGQKIKKRLETEEREAAIVRQIFKLFLEGDGTRGPLGIKEIAAWLNRHGFRNKTGNQFFTSCVHRILTRQTYSGLHHYNRIDSRRQKPRTKDEWIAVQVPAIISATDFNRVQALLHARRPNVTPPRITTSEVLLTGLARCESCGGALMLRTGTGKSGTTYRYYACARSHLKGRVACDSPVSIPERHLDDLVITALTGQLLTPDRLAALLRKAIAHRKANATGDQAKRTALRKELKKFEAQIERLLTAVAEGTICETSILRQKLDGLNQRREECIGLLGSLDAEQPALRQVLSKQQAASMASTLTRKLLDAPRALQKRYVHGLVSEIVVDRNKAVISGPPAAIAAAITAGALDGGVRTSVREWRPQGESNPCFSLERAAS